MSCLSVEMITISRHRPIRILIVIFLAIIPDNLVLVIFWLGTHFI